MVVVETEGVLGGKARLEGRRISVIQIAELVIDHAEDPATVADQFDISLSEVHGALAYYYEHPDAMNEQWRRRDELAAELAADSDAPDATDTVER
jgi:uncharacterized protein (DUF433 family)